MDSLAFYLLYPLIFVDVFAFASPNPLLVENHINRYRSNIARYSLVQCNKNMQAFNFELNIHQIRKE